MTEERSCTKQEQLPPPSKASEINFPTILIARIDSKKCYNNEHEQPVLANTRGLSDCLITKNTNKQKRTAKMESYFGGVKPDEVERVKIEWRIRAVKERPSSELS